MLLSLSFLPPLLIPLIDDADAMNLLLVERAMKRFFINPSNKQSVYMIKQTVKQSNVALLQSLDRYLPLQVSNVIDVTQPDGLCSINNDTHIPVNQLHQTSIESVVPYSVAVERPVSKQGLKRVAFHKEFNEAAVIPNTITHVVMGYKFSRPIRHSINQSINPTLNPSLVLGCSVTHLAFDNDHFMEELGYFNQPIRSMDLPETLTHLTFGLDFDQPISIEQPMDHSIVQSAPRSILPDSLKYLRFNGKFNQTVCGLPSQLTHLILGNEFNQPLSPSIDSTSNQPIDQPTNQQNNHLFNQSRLSNSITHLRFGYKYDLLLQPGSLPASLVHLILGAWYNRPITQGVLPSSLKRLQFDIHGSFNQLIDHGCLPGGLTYLHLGRDFNQPIGLGVLPASLRYLHLGNRFEQVVEPGTIPDSVTYLNFGYFFNHSINQTNNQSVVPRSVQRLTLGRKFNRFIEPGAIPASVKFLTLGSSFHQPINQPNDQSDSHNGSVNQSVISSSLTHLTLDLFFRDPIRVGSIPSSVTHLTIGNRYNVPIRRAAIPHTVKHLVLGKSYNQPLYVSVGQVVNQSAIQLTDFFDQSIRRSRLPDSITHLVLGAAFCQPLISASLPSGLTHLTFVGPYSQHISVGDIPSTVTHLEFKAMRFDGSMGASSIPSSVTHLTFPSVKQLLSFNALSSKLTVLTCLHNTGLYESDEFRSIEEWAEQINVMKKREWSEGDKSEEDVFERAWSDVFSESVEELES